MRSIYDNVRQVHTDGEAETSDEGKLQGSGPGVRVGL